MGTNYYVDAPGCPNACEHCTATERHHLGKAAAGWRFLFYAEPDWPRDRAFAHWVRRALSGRITDEYGDEHTLAELLALADKNAGGTAHPRSGFCLDPNFGSCGHDFTSREFC
jgi:hypothetical protein